MRHEVLIRRNADNAWQGLCRGCGAQSKPTSHKPAVEVWRRQHYTAAARGRAS